MRRKPSFPDDDERHPPPVYGDRPSRASLFYRRQKRLVRSLVLLLVFLALLGAGGEYGYRLLSEERFAPLRARFMALEPLQIRHIVVNGRKMTDEAEVMDQLGTTIGRPIFGFSVEAARKRISALPFVDHASVERHMPDTIIVTLVERSPIAIWQIHQRFLLINRNGEKIFDHDITSENTSAFQKLPLVVGDGANVAAASMIDLLQKFPSVKTQSVALIRIGRRRWNLLLRDGTVVLLPESTEEEALTRLARYEESLHLLERPVASIDMRLADRMVIHQNPPASSDTEAAPPAAEGQTPP